MAQANIPYSTSLGLLSLGLPSWLSRLKGLEPRVYGKTISIKEIDDSDDITDITITEGESKVAGSKRNLYSVEVPASDIYNLVEDPEDLLHKSKKASGMVVPNLDKVLKSLAKEDKPGLYPEYFTPIRGEDAKRYRGVYYRINQGTKDIVVWFDEIEATREDYKTYVNRKIQNYSVGTKK